VTARGHKRHDLTSRTINGVGAGAGQTAGIGPRSRSGWLFMSCRPMLRSPLSGGGPGECAGEDSSLRQLRRVDGANNLAHLFRFPPRFPLVCLVERPWTSLASKNPERLAASIMCWVAGFPRWMGRPGRFENRPVGARLTREPIQEIVLALGSDVEGTPRLLPRQTVGRKGCQSLPHRARPACGSAWNMPTN